jgi:rhodanese-related sulfurtransferase
VQPPQIEPSILSEKLAGDAKPLVLDVRQPQEVQADGRVADSLLIPMNELPARVGELPRDREIVAVCKRGQRSWNVAQWLRQQGYDATSLSGGLDAWTARGLPVAR